MQPKFTTFTKIVPTKSGDSFKYCYTRVQKPCYVIHKNIRKRKEYCVDYLRSKYFKTERLVQINNILCKRSRRLNGSTFNACHTELLYSIGWFYIIWLWAAFINHLSTVTHTEVCDCLSLETENVQMQTLKTRRRLLLPKNLWLMRIEMTIEIKYFLN